MKSQPMLRTTLFALLILLARPAWAADPGRELVLDLGNGVTMKLVQIPAGKFLMGSPATEKNRKEAEVQHEVTISSAFFMGVTAVTQEQYEAVRGNNPSRFKGKTNPVENVSAGNADQFCKRLSQLTDRTVQLPTEAQWEYACRAGSTTQFGFGDDEKELDQYAWYKGNSEKKSHPVGQKKPNAWGLYDMHGGVWQWCGDLYGEYDKGPVTDPTGLDIGRMRVLRGGSWNSTPAFCRSASRGGDVPDFRYDYYGFRVVVVIEPRVD